MLYWQDEEQYIHPQGAPSNRNGKGFTQSLPGTDRKIGRH